jgi:zinc/manganese transport system permease protein
MMLEMFKLPFMSQALVTCLLLALVLSYFGVHVVRRGIVFIDLALAQISSAGVATALLTGGDPRVFSIGFTLVGAFVLSLIRTHKRVPQEAIIGLIYAVSSAVSMLLIAKTAHGDADITAELFGNILAITPQQITELGISLGLIGLLHLVFYRQFTRMTEAYAETHASAPVFDLWNILFYLTLALAISESVSAAGVLQVFAYLIAPATCALLLFGRMKTAVLAAWGIALIASVGGLYSSYTYDLPTGAAIVAGFGILFILTLILARFARKNNE